MNSINFLPERYVELAERSRRRPMNFLAIGITAIALVGVWVLSDRSDALASQAMQLETKLHGIEIENDEADKIRRDIAGLHEQQAIHREIGQSVTTAQVLATIAQVAPAAIKLTDLQLVAHRATPAPRADPDPEARPQPKPKHEPAWLEVTLTGVAPEQDDIVALTRALSEHPLFTQVRLRASGNARAQRYEARTFLIELRIDLEREFINQNSQGGETHASP
ncbi:MAG: PilN domain-containing protein [Phycisphaerales bacterium JB063]